MLAGAVLNLILNYLLILQWGPWGVTPASFLMPDAGVFAARLLDPRSCLEIRTFRPWPSGLC